MPDIPASVDVAIAGGGVAGSTLARALASAGPRVLVVEREAVFRDRVRGEGIHPWGVREATRLGLEPVLAAAGANPLPIWNQYDDRRIVWSYAWAEDSVDGHPELAFSHPRLQQAALEAAEGAGAIVVRPGKVIALRPGERPEIDLVNEERTVTVRARLVVGADGKTSAIRRWAGIAAHRDPEHHRFGAGLFDGVELDPGAAHEANLPGGRVFLLPQGGGRVRAYLVFGPGVHQEVARDHTGAAMIALCGELFPEGAWAGARSVGPVAFFANADIWAERAATAGVALIGDAAGANDPSCGNGMSLVFRDARELRDLLVSGSPWDEALRVYAQRRAAYFDVLRQHAKWFGALSVEVGPDADRVRARVDRARRRDPSAGGFAYIFAKGPDGLVADEAARRRFFGEPA